jgi:outer membrane protein assembly factor BamB
VSIVATSLLEQGELALVGATSDGYRELARVPALEGKTWNHPALIDHLLLVRNGEEMAAFRLAPAGSRSASSLPR